MNYIRKEHKLSLAIKNGVGNIIMVGVKVAIIKYNGIPIELMELKRGE